MSSGEHRERDRNEKKERESNFKNPISEFLCKQNKLSTFIATKPVLNWFLTQF